MSLSLERLRQLRKQAGQTVPATASIRPVLTDQPVARETRRCVATNTTETLQRLLARRARGTSAASALRASSDEHERVLPGSEIAPGLWLIESFLPQAIPSEPLSLAFAKRPGEAVEPSQLLFFDTETTGLSGGTGTRAFMIGAADWWRDDDGHSGVRVRQLLIANLTAETTMLRKFSTWLGPDTVLSSYNGRCYDAPLLKTRYRLARQTEPLTPLDHVDLLFPSRRRWRGRWENCRLATIERQVLGVVREDDLPGSEAPAAWLGYLRGGSAANLRRVVQHNHQDVVSLAQLLLRLVEADAADQSPVADLLGASLGASC